MVRAGDIVRANEGDMVVVDVSEDEGGDEEIWAIVRPQGDIEGESLTAVSVVGLEVVGHADAIPGWEETEDGWRKLDD